MKGKNIDYARITNHFFAQVSATFQHASDNTKGLLHNPTDTYYSIAPNFLQLKYD